MLCQRCVQRCVGKRSLAHLPGMIAWSVGGYTGSPQTSTVILAGYTTNNTPTNLKISTFNAPSFTGIPFPTINNNIMTWGFAVCVVAHTANMNIPPVNSYWKIQGAIMRDFYGNVAFIGTPTTSSWQDSGFSGATTVVIANGALQVQVTGAASQAVQWMSRVTLDQLMTNE